jgi:AcrR family transcriptional regulator
MPRHPDPELERRILDAAQKLWKRGGDKALTMRTVARAARSNTPAVYRRFKDRDDILLALLRRIVDRIRKDVELAETLEGMAETYVELALREPHEYELFYSHASWLTPPKLAARPLRESRPNFAFLEQQLAKRFGGQPEEYTQLALALWATLHGTCMLLLGQGIPEAHAAELRCSCRTAVQALLEKASLFRQGN